MVTTNQILAEALQRTRPHTFNALTKLVMAMADYAKNWNKKTLFGRDKGLEAYKRFDAKLRDTLLCLVLDGVVARDASPEDFRRELFAALGEFSNAYPNWHDAYVFAFEFFHVNHDACDKRIAQLLSAG